jgi:serine/threonine protein phosphatase PrpC
MSLNTQDTADYRATQDFTEGFFVPPFPAVTVEFGAASHVGRVRERNEDNFAIFRRTRTQKSLLTSLADGILANSGDEAFGFVVADGMGGAAAGELASRVAIETAWDLAEQASSWVMRLRDLATQQVQERTEAFVSEMHRTLREIGEANPRLTGMGTTWTSVYVVGWHALVAQVGDSRVYHWRQGTLRQVTRDQTLAQVLIDSGVPPEDTSKVRHILTNSLGGKEKVITPDVGHFVLEDGDRLLLCTDGLTDEISDSEMAERLTQRVSPQTACEAMVQLALDHGGKDNVTVLLAEFTQRPAPPVA